jgi:hypothetical protein
MRSIHYGCGVDVWSGAGAPTHRIAWLTDPAARKSLTRSRTAVCHDARDVQLWCIYAMAQ